MPVFSFAAPAALLLALAVPATAELSLGGYAAPEEVVEEAVEEQVEDTVEQAVQEEVQEVVEEAVEEIIEEELGLSLGGYIEAQVEESVEEAVEEQVAEVVEDTVEESVEEGIELVVEEQVEDVISEAVEETLEETLEESVEEIIEESVEQVAEEAVEQAVEESIAATVEESVQDSVEEAVEEGVAQAVDESVGQTVEAQVEQRVEVSVAQSVEENVADSVEERLETEIDEILDNLESDLEIDEDRIHKEQWLVMAEPEVFEELAEQGYLFDTVTDLPALGMRLAEVAGPSSFDITEVRRGVLDVVGKDRAEVDLNHIYTAGTQLASSAEGVRPRVAASLPAELDNASPRIGMIDSRVDTSHPSLVNSRIESRSFTAEEARQPEFHGTAIASIIAANAPDYRGLAPNAEVYAAAVFEQDRERGEIASTVSLLRAIDWLVSSQVEVVNISLAGPPNRLLEAALGRAVEQDILVMAAAGNGGPVAKPMYPAAYGSVVAVTAVDNGHQVFRLANRGDYLDIAAPGVDVLHAKAGGGYAASSGTSFAVPFAVTAAAALRQSAPGTDILDHIYRSAVDLGPPGRDDIYGYGLLQFTGG